MDNQSVPRRANYSHIDALSQLYQKAFRETFMEDFASLHPENDLDSHFCLAGSPEYFCESLNDPQQATWLIEGKTNGELVPSASVARCDPDDISHPDVCLNKNGAINRLYVLLIEYTKVFFVWSHYVNLSLRKVLFFRCDESK